jgi:hypothetical protein
MPGSCIQKPPATWEKLMIWEKGVGGEGGRGGGGWVGPGESSQGGEPGVGCRRRARAGISGVGRVRRCPRSPCCWPGPLRPPPVLAARARTLTSAARPCSLISRAFASAASVAASAAARLQSPIASHHPPLLPPRPRDAGVDATRPPQRRGVRTAVHCALREWARGAPRPRSKVRHGLCSAPHRANSITSWPAPPAAPTWPHPAPHTPRATHTPPHLSERSASSRLYAGAGSCLMRLDRRLSLSATIMRGAGLRRAAAGVRLGCDELRARGGGGVGGASEGPSRGHTCGPAAATHPPSPTRPTPASTPVAAPPPPQPPPPQSHVSSSYWVMSPSIASIRRRFSAMRRSRSRSSSVSPMAGWSRGRRCARG